MNSKKHAWSHTGISRVCIFLSFLTIASAPLSDVRGEQLPFKPDATAEGEAWATYVIDEHGEKFRVAILPFISNYGHKRIYGKKKLTNMVTLWERADRVKAWERLLEELLAQPGENLPAELETIMDGADHMIGAVKSRAGVGHSGKDILTSTYGLMSLKYVKNDVIMNFVRTKLRWAHKQSKMINGSHLGNALTVIEEGAYAAEIARGALQYVAMNNDEVLGRIQLLRKAMRSVDYEDTCFFEALANLETKFTPDMTGSRAMGLAIKDALPEIAGKVMLHKGQALVKAAAKKLGVAKAGAIGTGAAMLLVLGYEEYKCIASLDRSVEQAILSASLARGLRNSLDKNWEREEFLDVGTLYFQTQYFYYDRSHSSFTGWLQKMVGWMEKNVRQNRATYKRRRDDAKDNLQRYQQWVQRQRSLHDGKSILIVLDTSGSMGARSGKGKETRFKVAMNALREVLDSVPEQDSVEWAMFSFGNDNPVLTAPFSSDPQDIWRAASRCSPKGGTPLARTIEAAANYGLVGGRFSELHMIILSDGEDSERGDPAETIRRIQSSIEEYRKSIRFQKVSRSPEWHEGSLVSLPTGIFTDMARPIKGLPAALLDSIRKAPRWNVAEGWTLNVSVVGYGLDSGSRKQLKSLARAAGGKLMTAGTAAELTRSLRKSIAGTGARMLPPQEQWVRGVSSLGNPSPEINIGRVLVLVVFGLSASACGLLLWFRWKSVKKRNAPTRRSGGASRRK